MTQTAKDLLLKDLCARLPYGVKLNMKGLVGVSHHTTILYGKNTEIYFRYACNDYFIDEVKPYLFPLSSMTEGQRIELYKALGWGYESHYHLSKEWEDFNNSIDNNDLFIPASWVSDINKMYNWLNKNHFDYHGLIPMGLAEDASGKNIY